LYQFHFIITLERFKNVVEQFEDCTEPPIQWIPGALFLGIKRPWREADHSPPSSAEVKNAWSYTYTPPTRLHGVVLSQSTGTTSSSSSSSKQGLGKTACSDFIFFHEVYE
jgi:hypothetical protein